MTTAHKKWQELKCKKRLIEKNGRHDLFFGFVDVDGVVAEVSDEEGLAVQVDAAHDRHGSSLKTGGSIQLNSLTCIFGN